MCIYIYYIYINIGDYVMISMNEVVKEVVNDIKEEKEVVLDIKEVAVDVKEVVLEVVKDESVVDIASVGTNVFDSASVTISLKKSSETTIPPTPQSIIPPHTIPPEDGSMDIAPTENKVYRYIYTYIYIYIYIHTYIYIYIYIYSYLYLYKYTHVYTFKYIYIYIYI
jgi:hypothetical protein